MERVNRWFTSIRGDGIGDRYPKGMDTNPILLTVMETDWINKASFFDHLVRSSSGYGSAILPRTVLKTHIAGK